MIDAVAGTAVLVGAVLAVLAGLGLLRFPDVLSRLHAATKPATIGVIATTLAAVVEVDRADAVALLLLVVALLFLSAPLSASALANAAYRDPDTPRPVTVRDDLAAAVDAGGADQAADERPGKPVLLAGWLVVVWVALFASGTPGVALGAVVVAVGVTALLPGYRPRWPEGVLRPVAVVRFAAAFAWLTIAANLDVALAVVSRRRLSPAIIRVPLRVTTATEVTLLANVISFTPGTIAVAQIAGNLYVHVLDLRDEDAFHRSVRDLESRVIAAFGTRPERATALGGTTGAGGAGRSLRD